MLTVSPSEEVRPPHTRKAKKRFPMYDTQLHLVMRLHFWSSGEYGVTLHCHYSPVQSDPGLVVPTRVPSIYQMDLDLFKECFVFERIVCRRKKIFKKLHKKCWYFYAPIWRIKLTFFHYGIQWHSQLVNTTRHVTLTGRLLTGRSHINKNKIIHSWPYIKLT